MFGLDTLINQVKDVFGGGDSGSLEALTESLPSLGETGLEAETLLNGAAEQATDLLGQVGIDAESLDGAEFLDLLGGEGKDDPSS